MFKLILYTLCLTCPEAEQLTQTEADLRYPYVFECQDAGVATVKAGKADAFECIQLPPEASTDLPTRQQTSY